MQLKHPEILWALLLLIIPILIHFFQLRRFKRTPFTNVAMLQKVVMESRKSNTLKKWLLLLTRLLLLTAFIIAFAQPYTAKTNALKKRENVIFLDNSFSMQAKTNGLTLLEKAVQELLKHIDKDETISLFTNTNTFKDVAIEDIQNRLLELQFSHQQLNLKDVKLKASTLFSSNPESQKNLIVISDFQNRMTGTEQDSTQLVTSYMVPMRANDLSNVSIDSVFIEDTGMEQLGLQVFLRGTNVSEPVPVSLFNGDTLIAKSAANFEESLSTTLNFSIPNNQSITGQLELTDSGLGYDNVFFFTLNERPKLKILSISETLDTDQYLTRLFTQDEFELSQFQLSTLDYSLIDNQNVVVLDNLNSIPTGLERILTTFKDNGGSLVVIPSPEIDLNSYNAFLSNFFNSRFYQVQTSEKKITSISYDHPLYRNVFENQVENFEYPSTKQYYQLTSGAPKILSLEGNDAFLVGLDGFYLFTSSLLPDFCNFKSSSLIVPTFYNMALSGLQTPERYQILGKTSTIDLPVVLGNEEILNVGNSREQFIPLQQTFPNKVRLTFNENPKTAGIYEVSNSEDGITNISFNYPRNESQLSFTKFDDLPNTTIKESVGSLFQLLAEEASVTPYWKWFVILALLLALVEVIIQKFVT